MKDFRNERKINSNAVEVFTERVVGSSYFQDSLPFQPTQHPNFQRNPSSLLIKLCGRMPRAYY